MCKAVLAGPSFYVRGNHQAVHTFQGLVNFHNFAISSDRLQMVSCKRSMPVSSSYALQRAVAERLLDKGSCVERILEADIKHQRGNQLVVGKIGKFLD